MEALKVILFTLAQSKVFKLVVVAIVLDTFFGAGRAIKKRCFNSSVGIDGAIRKVSMMLSLVGLGVVDAIIDINLIGFIPEAIRAYFPNSLAVVGLADFFGILYICYEAVSILKNMVLCGLPVKGIWKAVRKFLGKYTEELPDADELAEVTSTEVKDGAENAKG